MTTRDDFRQRSLGLTLVELLVALAIFAVAGAITLTVYEKSRQLFKTGEMRAEMQQAARIAFDRLVSDIRMAGFNHNPDGNRLMTGEQIEAAYDTAIVFRADLDAEDPAAAASPETSLAGDSLVAVSIGNDEIVAYVLAKPDGSSTDTLTFAADVKDVPRDGTVETVRIPGVALVHDDPPYTLYRVTLNTDVNTWGGPDFFVRTPLIDNVSRMSFRYFGRAGGQINGLFDLTDPGDDIGGAETAARRLDRGAIRRIGVDLEVIARAPDMDWIDVDDPDPDTRAFRKFDLGVQVTPRNLGMLGIRDLRYDEWPPSRPARPTLIPGHCGGLHVSWPANPSDELVKAYRVSYGTDPGIENGWRMVAGTSTYLGGLDDGRPYYVTIRAQDDAGNLSGKSDVASATTADVNTPLAPTNVAASDDLSGAVRLTWDAVMENSTTEPSADPDAPRVRDLAGYRIYRGEAAGFPPDDAHRIADESAVRASLSPLFSDTGVVNCKPYHYLITAVDRCGNESVPSAVTIGSGFTTDPPRAPVNAQAFLTGESNFELIWDEVHEDVDGDRIYIETYNIYRSRLWSPDSAPTRPGDFILIDQVDDLATYGGYERAPLDDDAEEVHWYAISAIDACPNESSLSDAVRPTCEFSGEVVFASPERGEPVAGVVPVRVEVVGGDERYRSLTLEFRHEGTGTVEERIELSEDGSAWTYNWLADPPGPYTIVASVENDSGCTRVATVRVAAGYDVGCCLAPQITGQLVLECTGSGGASGACKRVTYPMINNNCLTSVAIESMIVSWRDVVGNGARLGGVLLDGAPIWHITPSADTPASTTFSDPLPSIDASRDRSYPVTVSYVFDKVTSDRIGSTYLRDTMKTSFSYRLLDSEGLPTAITGTCGPATGVFDSMIVEPHN